MDIEELTDKLLKGRDLSLEKHRILIKDTLLELNAKDRVAVNELVEGIKRSLGEYQASTSQDKWLFVKDVEIKLGISDTTIHEWNNCGILPKAEKIAKPGTKRKITAWRESVIDGWLELDENQARILVAKNNGKKGLQVKKNKITEEDVNNALEEVMNDES